ncbi:MAG: 50S ribosomal protein L30 [Candidatus Muiribacteriota bacterium]|jgi:large subunit ribosomal protein L30
MALEIKLVKSMIGRPENQRATLRALGLRKINSVVKKERNPQIDGMVATVKHLVEVKEV